MDDAPSDLDATRAAIAARDLVATASGYLTTDIAIQLPFESLVPFKTLLKQFFSTAPWSTADAEALSEAFGELVVDAARLIDVVVIARRAVTGDDCELTRVQYLLE